MSKTKIVIIGAGPSGLYLAYRLNLKGIPSNDIVIYDPRAGEYSRPGDIEKKIYMNLQYQLEHQHIKRKQRVHIKDIENLLYKEIKNRNINIEKMKFVKFNDDIDHPGVIVVDSEGLNKLVECEFAFDCTGTHRVLINAVNQLYDDEPFKIEHISSAVRVNQHIIAYIKMDNESLKSINRFNQRHENLSREIYNSHDTQITDMKLENSQYPLSSIEYVHGIEELRTLGWNEFGYPKMYGVTFGKGKVCLYTECPDNLPEQQYENWIQKTINVITNSKNLKFEQLQPSKKAYHKPRFSYFTLNPKVLSPSNYKTNGIPLVIAIGDAEVEPHYVRAQGLRFGFDRIWFLLEVAINTDGNISNLDKNRNNRYRSEYNITRQIKETKEFYEARSKYFDWYLEKAKQHYLAALNEDLTALERSCFNITLLEIRVRKFFISTVGLDKHFNHSVKTLLLVSPYLYLQSNLYAIQNSLFNAFDALELEDLPKTINSIKLRIIDLLLLTAINWQALGNFYFHDKQHENALKAYNNASNIVHGRYQIVENKSDLHIDEINCEKQKLHSLNIKIKSKINYFFNNKTYTSDSRSYFHGSNTFFSINLSARTIENYLIPFSHNLGL